MPIEKIEDGMCVLCPLCDGWGVLTNQPIEFAPDTLAPIDWADVKCAKCGGSGRMVVRLEKLKP